MEFHEVKMSFADLSAEEKAWICDVPNTVVIQYLAHFKQLFFDGDRRVQIQAKWDARKEWRALSAHIEPTRAAAKKGGRL